MKHWFSNQTKWILAASFMLAATGFLLPFWPLSLLGIIIAGGSGRWMFAVFIGVLLDVAYGTPIGIFHVLYFPFTIAALGVALLRFAAGRYLWQRHRETLSIE